MPELITCPDCDRKLRVPDDLIGKKVKCPGCGVAFTATAPSAARGGKASRPADAIEETPRSGKKAKAPPPEDEDEDDRPRSKRARDEDDRPRRRRDEDDEDEAPRGRRRDREEEDFEEEDDRSPRAQDKEGWKKVRLGGTLMSIAVGCIALEIIVSLIGAFFILGTATPQMVMSGRSSGMVIMLQVCTNVLFWGGVVTWLVGWGFCLAVPVSSGQKGMSWATLGTGVSSLLFYGVSLLIFIFGVASAMAGAMGGGADPWGMLRAGYGLMIMFILVWVLLLAHLACSILFFKGVGERVKARGFVQNCLYLLITFAVLVVSLIGLVGLLFAAGAAVIGSGGPMNQAQANAMGGSLMLWGICSCLNIILGLGWGIWYIVTIFLFRGVVDRQIRRG